MIGESPDRRVRVEVITSVQCQHSEVSGRPWGSAGRSTKSRSRQRFLTTRRASFRLLSEWMRTLPKKFGDRVSLRVVDVLSVEGFLSVDGPRYAGCDFLRVEALIAERLAVLIS